MTDTETDLAPGPPALPPLYKRTSTGAIEVWRIWAVGDRYFTEHGQLGGRMVASEGTLCVGKNVGRSNETSSVEQALLEARSRWERKAKSGYVESEEAARAGDVDADFVAGGVLPMLAHVYEKHAAKLDFPVYVQPKLDGHRCLAVVNDDGSVGLWSRTRKPIKGVPHVVKAVEALGLDPGTVLDGELYSHAYRDRFEELTSYVRQATPKPGHEAVEYHVYDLAEGGHGRVGFENMGFAFRHQLLTGILRGAGSPLVHVTTSMARNPDDLAEYLAEYVSRGYEGAMARNREGAYAGRRSYDLQKVKDMLDDEFEVVGVEEGRGRMEGRAVFVCRCAGGEFRVKMQGPLEALRAYVDDPSLAVGRLLTVKFQNLTAEGMPRFPVGLRFREDA